MRDSICTIRKSSLCHNMFIFIDTHNHAPMYNYLLHFMVSRLTVKQRKLDPSIISCNYYLVSIPLYLASSPGPSQGQGYAPGTCLHAHMHTHTHHTHTLASHTHRMVVVRWLCWDLLTCSMITTLTRRRTASYRMSSFAGLHQMTSHSTPLMLKTQRCVYVCMTVPYPVYIQLQTSFLDCSHKNHPCVQPL